MKYAFMSFSCPELSLQQMLDLADELGYDGIEPRVDSGHAHGVELDTDAAAREVIRRTVESNSADLACIATSCRYSDPETTRQQIQQTLAAIDMAADVGAPAIRVFGGNIPEGISRKDAIKRLTSALNALKEQAAERGIFICVETHDHWCNPEHLAKVMKNVDHPNIAVNWDIMHPVRAEKWSVAASFEVLLPWIGHVHFHDGNVAEGGAELTPIGQGGVDHRTAVELLAGAGYDGYLSGELINWIPYREHLPRELATMKKYEEQAVH